MSLVEYRHMPFIKTFSVIPSSLSTLPLSFRGCYRVKEFISIEYKQIRGLNVPYHGQELLLKCLNRTLITLFQLNKLDFNWYLINLFANSPIPLARLATNALSALSGEWQWTCHCTNYNLDGLNPDSFVTNVT